MPIVGEKTVFLPRDLGRPILVPRQTGQGFRNMLQGISAWSTSLLHRAPQSVLIATIVLIMGHAFVQSCGADIMI